MYNERKQQLLPKKEINKVGNNASAHTHTHKLSHNSILILYLLLNLVYQAYNLVYNSAKCRHVH